MVEAKRHAAHPFACDEDLDRAGRPGDGVEDRQRVAGKIDEQLLAGHVRLSHRG